MMLDRSTRKSKVTSMIHCSGSGAIRKPGQGFCFVNFYTVSDAPNPARSRVSFRSSESHRRSSRP